MIKNIDRYVIGTIAYGILLPNRVEQVEVLCWTDADWARYISNKSSRTGMLVTLNGGRFIRTSKFQTSTTPSILQDVLVPYHIL